MSDVTRDVTNGDASQNSRVRPLIHIGYHKTGTTWLQKFLFPSSEAGFVLAMPRSEIARHLIEHNALDFDPHRCREALYPTIVKAAEHGLVPVLSSERLSGNPHSGGYDSKELANRLAEVFPEGKVLMVIREQKGMVLSAYKQYVRVGGTCSLVDYLRPPLHGRLRVPLFDFGYFRYDRLIRHYGELLGASNVLALPYEIFRDDPAGFVAEIIRFAGADATHLSGLPYADKTNEALSSFMVAAQRRINRFAARDSTNPDPLWSLPGVHRRLLRAARRVEKVVPASYQKSVNEKMKAAVEEMVGDYYKESNCATSRLIQRDLRSYGYDV